jgi:hypothetical protein
LRCAKNYCAKSDLSSSITSLRERWKVQIFSMTEKSLLMSELCSTISLETREVDGDAFAKKLACIIAAGIAHRIMPADCFTETERVRNWCSYKSKHPRKS